MRIALIGSRGMLGSSFSDDRIIRLNRPEIDVTRIDTIKEQISRIQPQVIINCSGITDIPFCQENPDAAFQVNLGGAVNVAAVCFKHKIKLIQFSTTFSGNTNIYTKTKMYMENILPEIIEDYAILRLPWLFSKVNDKKFLSTIISCLKEHKPVPIYEDEVGSPTYTYDVTSYVLGNISSLKGIHDMANKGVVTRRQWASKVSGILGYKDISFGPMHRKIPMNTNSVVNKGIILRDWQEALEECLG